MKTLVFTILFVGFLSALILYSQFSLNSQIARITGLVTKFQAEGCNISYEATQNNLVYKPSNSGQECFSGCEKTDGSKGKVGDSCSYFDSNRQTWTGVCTPVNTGYTCSENKTTDELECICSRV